MYCSPFSRANVFGLLPVSVLIVFSLPTWGVAQQQVSGERSLGLFSVARDIGEVAHRGSVQFDPVAGRYAVTGGGTNMWGTVDAFHFVWCQCEGDLTLAADIQFLGTGGNPHRKACLIIRQTLDPDAVYADVAVHGDGLTSIQYREERGGTTREIQSRISKPHRVGITRVGDYVSMSLAAESGRPLDPAGGAFRIKFAAPFYVGLGVCSHDNLVTETALFSDVVLERLKARDLEGPMSIESTLEVVPISSGDRRVVYHRIARNRFEAPNWAANDTLIFNDDGSLVSIPVDGSRGPTTIDCGNLSRLNNDHGISPDGKWIAISDQTQPGGSRVYVMPFGGGQPRLVAEQAPSYWHGWSPDGKSVVYCAQREGDYDVYRISLDGGSEQRLTSSPGLDDGPEYSADGQYIYFNSVRSGSMQIWRMKPDGSEPTQVTNDEFHNWFAHPSPDGRWLAFVSYSQEDVEPDDHPPYKDVQVRLMPIDSSGKAGSVRVLAKLLGGQGTMNVPSWSPDSRQLAFVSYRLVPDEHADGQR